MKRREFEHALSYHCAPSLLGIKPSDLFTWPVERYQEILTYQSLLLDKGITLRVLKKTERRALVLVYRENKLFHRLACPAVAEMLHRAGYPVGGTLEEYFTVLEQRLHHLEFPHEIGLFLGYPPEDVEGFCRMKGQQYKLCGCWKVYGDEKAAKAYFERCDRCRAILCSRLVTTPLTSLLRSNKELLKEA